MWICTCLSLGKCRSFQEVFWTSEECCTGIAWFHSRDLAITAGFSHTWSFHRDFLQIFTHLHTSVRATQRKFQHCSFKWGLGREAFVLRVVTVRQTQWAVQQRASTPLRTLEFSKDFRICTLTFARFDSFSNLLCPCMTWNEMNLCLHPLPMPPAFPGLTDQWRKFIPGRYFPHSQALQLLRR